MGISRNLAVDRQFYGGNRQEQLEDNGLFVFFKCVLMVHQGSPKIMVAKNDEQKGWFGDLMLRNHHMVMVNSEWFIVVSDGSNGQADL